MIGREIPEKYKPKLPSKKDIEDTVAATAREDFDAEGGGSSVSIDPTAADDIKAEVEDAQKKIDDAKIDKYTDPLFGLLMRDNTIKGEFDDKIINKAKEYIKSELTFAEMGQFSKDIENIVNNELEKFLDRYRKSMMVKISDNNEFNIPVLDDTLAVRFFDTLEGIFKVNYFKGGYINRNNILMNDDKYMFTLPLLGASQNKFIRDIKIYDDKWKIKFLKTIESAYKKAPFYDEIFMLLNNIFEKDVVYLSEFVYISLSKICDYLDIKTLLIEHCDRYENDNLKGQDKIMDICIKEKADTYINPIGALDLDLYNSELFKNNNMNFFFIKMNDIKYKQFNGEFVSNLSVIDLLMFNSKDELKTMLESYELIRN